MYFIVNSLGFMVLHWSATVTLLSNVIGAFIITLTYPGEWKYRILAPVIVTALNMLCEDMIFRVLLSVNVENIVVVGIALTNLALLMIILLLQKLSDLQHGEDISTAEFAGIIAVPLISGIISIITLSDCKSEMAMTVGGVGLLVLNVMVFYLLERLTKMYKKQTVMAALEGQNKAYEKQLEIVRQSEENAAAVRHDMKNHITVLHYMAEKDGNKDISDYLEKINSYFKNGERFICTGDPLIDGLINLKLSEAAYKLETEVIHEVHIENTDKLDKMEFSIVISNLLDNALDALKLCDNRRKLYVAIEEKNGLLLIKIHNTYNGTILLEKGNIITSKGNRKEHGIGLKNVKKIIDKYNGEININYDTNIFKSEIIMYLK
jgi:sensor histidine kinase YesM